MPRKTAAARHRESAPKVDTWPPAGDDLVEALIALHQPARRQLYELLSVQGPLSVGRLAALTGLAPGSISHHLKALHRSGFVEPAPDHARDTRESWWRAHRRRLSWSAEVYDEGTAARNVADLAERANFEHHNRAIVAWMRTRASLPEPWSELGTTTENLVRATREQFEDFERRLGALAAAWYEECLADAEDRPDVGRYPVRFIARLFPSDPATGALR
jgi:DNA-binding transcriptional ArsR family regulator